MPTKQVETKKKDGIVLKKKSKESKADKFKRLVPSRVVKVKKALRILGNCSNKANYEYTVEQIEKIFVEIQESLDINHSKFIENVKQDDNFNF